MTSTFRWIICARQCACLLILCGVMASTALGRSLSDLIAAIDSTSPALAEARYSLAQAKAEFTSSRALPNPILFGENQRLEDGGTTEREQTVGIRQPLGFLWSQPSKIASKRLEYETARAGFEEERRQIIASVIVNISQVKALETQAIVLDTVLSQAVYVGEVVKARLQQGDISDYQARRIQAELVQLHGRRVALSQILSDETGQFVELSGMPLDDLRDVAIPEIADPSLTDANDAVAYAMDHRERVRARRKSRESAHKALTASTLNLLPDFSVGIAQRTADPHFSGSVWQAEIAIPLFDQRRSARYLARANELRTQQLYDGELHIVEQQARSAWRQWQLAQNARTATDGFVQPNGQLELNRAVRLFLSGELSTLEFVDALRTNLDAIQAELELEIGILRANLELRRVTGLNMVE